MLRINRCNNFLPKTFNFTSKDSWRSSSKSFTLRNSVFPAGIPLLNRCYHHHYPKTFPHPPYAHLKGDDSVPLIEKTLGDFMDRQVAEYTSQTVLHSVYQNERFSWMEMQRHVVAMARGLMKLGFEKGDRIGVWMPNNYEWVVTQLAVSKIGVILVNINPAYRSHELEHALNLVECKGLIITPTFKSSNYVTMIRSLCPHLSRHGIADPTSSVPSLSHVIHTGHEHIDGLIRFEDIYDDTIDYDIRDRLRYRQRSLDCYDPINIQFTSGTTGLPKGATLTHRNILNNGFFVGEQMRLTPDDMLCVPVPLYHCFGLVLGNLACLTHGSGFVYPSAGFDAEATLCAVEEDKCTGLHGVPTMFIAELDHLQHKSYNLSSLRTGIMAGSTCPIEIMKRVIKEMNLTEITITYGMTETSPASFQTRAEDPIEARTDTVGRIHPHVECKVINEDGETVQIDQVGELCTRGYNVMSGYWNDGDKSDEAIDADGFIHTGDQAMFDADGYCHIVGRLKDMIIRGGENIYPREIEEFLHQHPRVRDVAIVGVPDPRYGEEICAWIIPQNYHNSNNNNNSNNLNYSNEITLEEVKEFAQGKIAHFKIPRYVICVDRFPLTVTGKIQKYKMREQSIEILEINPKK
eukprot:gb/GECH01008911.1/.p1 GENE.gb/GECH01008911.1/~~gb/GECH01008911.1/.p1  ORF type:complete len:633 (+),score=147.22 gb/GECH01008911.1/:1-1899(+)